MTEAEWQQFAEPGAMLVAVRDQVSGRKLRLFACAVCRRMRYFGEQAVGAAAVNVSEQYADGRASADELSGARSAARALWSTHHEPTVAAARLPRGIVAGACYQVARPDEWKVILEIGLVATAGGCQPRGRADLIREIFGNPFRPVAFSPSWRTDTAVTLTRTMYESRDFGAMPILADALQDAGCDNDDVLDHCRGSGPHVRGCWVCDLVLEKE